MGLNLESILTELKRIPAVGIVTLGKSSLADLRAYLSSGEPKMARGLRRLRTAQAALITQEAAKRIIEQGRLPQGVMDEMTRLARAFVETQASAAYRDALGAAGGRIAGEVNRARKQEFMFDSTEARVVGWMVQRGGELIVELTAAQYSSINALLVHQAFIGITSPYQMANMLKPEVGLLARHAQAVARLNMELFAEGLPAETILKQTAKYADFLHKYRTQNIARTELSSAYNRGQLESILQARDDGYLAGVEKTWLTAEDERTCDDCDGLDGETVGVDDNFSNGLESAPAHPGCRCSVSYRAARR